MRTRLFVLLLLVGSLLLSGCTAELRRPDNWQDRYQRHHPNGSVACECACAKPCCSKPLGVSISKPLTLEPPVIVDEIPLPHAPNQKKGW